MRHVKRMSYLTAYASEVLGTSCLATRSEYYLHTGVNCVRSFVKVCWSRSNGNGERTIRLASAVGMGSGVSLVNNIRKWVQGAGVRGGAEVVMNLDVVASLIKFALVSHRRSWMLTLRVNESAPWGRTA